MTIITYHGSDHSPFQSSSFGAFVRPALRLTLRLRDEWQRRRTEKMLEGLPAEIRKDIGWPTTNAAPRR